MENQVNSKNIILNYGLYLGIAGILLHLIMYATGSLLEPQWYMQVATYLLFIVLVVLGIKKYKEDNGGFMSWTQAVKIGVGIAIFSALISGIYSYIFSNFIEPDFIAKSIEFQNQKMLDMGYTEEQMEMANKMSEKFKNPAIIAAMGTLISAIGGFIVSAIAGAIMKESAEEEY